MSASEKEHRTAKWCDQPGPHGSSVTDCVTLLLLFSHKAMSDSFVTPWTVACQAPLSTGFPRQEYWSGLLLPGGSPMVKNLLVIQKTQVWSLDLDDPLEKGMATHSSILAWRIPWTEEPGRLTVHGVTESGTTKWLTHTSLVYSDHRNKIL